MYNEEYVDRILDYSSDNCTGDYLAERIIDEGGYEIVGTATTASGTEGVQVNWVFEDGSSAVASSRKNSSVYKFGVINGRL